MPAEFSMDLPEAGSPPPATSIPEGGEDRPDGSEPSPAEPFHGNHVWDLEADDSRPAPAAAPAAPAPKAPPTPEPAPAAAPEGPSLQDLQRQLEETRQQLQTYEQRYRDTREWGNQANMVRSAAEALVQAQQQKEYVEGQLRARQAAMAPPDLGDLDELLQDPKKLKAGFDAYGEWAYRRAIGDLSPTVAYLSGQLQRIQAAAPLVEYVARTRAKDALVAAGQLDAEQADKLLDRAVSDVINHEQNAADYRLSPEALVYAANIVLQREGAPIKAKPKPAPSAGQGAPRTATPKGPALSPNAARAAKQAERFLGRAFTDDERAELARMNARA